jgi:hypothetical protein
MNDDLAFLIAVALAMIPAAIGAYVYWRFNH